MVIPRSLRKKRPKRCETNLDHGGTQENRINPVCVSVKSDQNRYHKKIRTTCRLWRFTNHAKVITLITAESVRDSRRQSPSLARGSTCSRPMTLPYCRRWGACTYCGMYKNWPNKALWPRYKQAWRLDIELLIPSTRASSEQQGFSQFFIEQKHNLSYRVQVCI